MSIVPDFNIIGGAEDPKPLDPDCVCVFDGDEIAFRIAAVCEQRGILVTNTSNDAKAGFKHKTEFNKLIGGLEIPDGHFVLEETQIAEPAQNAFRTIKSKIINTMKVCGASDYEVFISGDTNFRDDIPLPRKYKGGRTGVTKPLLLQECRDYLVTYHKAQPVHGIEADDMLTQRMEDGARTKKKIIGVTVDKDAKQQRGWLFNPDTMKKPEYIKGLGSLWMEGEKVKKLKGNGRKFLYYQWVFGDKVDCYDPRNLVKDVTGKSPPFGEMAAFKLLGPLETDKDCLLAIQALYIKWLGTEEFTYTTHDGKETKANYLDAMQMYLDCARMLRWEGDTINVTDMLDKVGIKY